MSDTAPPQLHVDSDWKSQAREEKERLAKQESQRAASGEPRPGELPPADFKSLIGVIASQAIMGLGAMGDQKTGRVVVDLPGAKFSIDLLDVIEKKTQGNLTPDEAEELKLVLAELRARFVQINQLVARQMAAGAAAPAAPAR
jgi:hypothetical protein